jgi:hypothetical protein
MQRVSSAITPAIERMNGVPGADGAFVTTDTMLSKTVFVSQSCTMGTTEDRVRMSSNRLICPGVILQASRRILGVNLRTAQISFRLIRSAMMSEHSADTWLPPTGTLFFRLVTMSQHSHVQALAVQRFNASVFSIGLRQSPSRFRL